MKKKLNKNAKVDKFTNMLGIAVRLIVIDPFNTENVDALEMLRINWSRP